MIEKAKRIKGFPNYGVTVLGVIYNLKKRTVLNYTKNRRYLMVALSEGGISKDVYVHRLVAEAFLPNPENKAQINHKDGNKLNPILTNLEWVTPKENMRHAKQTGLLNSQLASCKKRRVLTAEESVLIKQLYSRRGEYNICTLSKKYNVGTSTIHRLLKGTTYKEIA